jgi:hypothetical protein
MPASPDKVFDVWFDCVWKFWAKVFFCEFGDDFFEVKLSVLPILGDDLIEDDSKGVDVCRFARLQYDIISVLEQLHCSIHRFVGVTCY